MQHKVLDKTLEVCRRIENSRDLKSIFNHAKGEIEELHDEIVNVEIGKPEGPDGVIGEAVDVMLCMVDIIYKRNPDITKEQIFEVICSKLDKWELLYSEKKEDKDE